MDRKARNKLKIPEVNQNYHQLLFLNMALLMGYCGCCIGAIFVGNFIFNTEHWVNLVLGLLVLIFMPAMIYLARKEKQEIKEKIDQLAKIK